ncbi:hypothetical protein AA12717_1455 [Gluconacetobacter sacchari DSM 12717]|nr:hypothetical protein AA12717_1455 [Gluconacetobacter sacchari DSM 12717]
MGRAIGIILLIALLMASALHARREAERDQASHAAVVMQSDHDALASDLARCQALGMKADGDPACVAIWAESRKRFFSPDVTR